MIKFFCMLVLYFLVLVNNVCLLGDKNFYFYNLIFIISYKYKNFGTFMSLNSNKFKIFLKGNFFYIFFF